jgi:GTP-binding protein EngB required for normal cell division
MTVTSSTTSVDVTTRLGALAELTRLGTARVAADGPGFDPALLKDAEQLLRRSGERMRMSATHTVVALAGGTGSGKSSLFNALSGASFSPPGVTRPTTRHSHACVWGMEGAAPLLDWLGVQRRHRYARASALDEGETSLNGLLLLDLPDHDSVVSGSAALVDRLVKLADMLVWVLDPLKYADAAVHQRYLVPLAGHSAVTTVVLNQSDTLSTEEIDDCAADLRRLLDAEGLLDTQVLVTSATTGAGLDELKAVLAVAVAARHAASDRIAADIDALLDRFTVYSGAPLAGVPAVERAAQAEQGAVDDEDGIRDVPPWELWAEEEAAGDAPDTPAVPPWEAEGDWSPPGSQNGQATPASRPPWEDVTSAAGPAVDPVGYVPAAPGAALAAAFEKAAGMSAVTEGLHSARERIALRYVGWPLGRLRRTGHAPASKQPEQAGPQQAQRSDIDNAITAFSDAVLAGEHGGTVLPEPWSHTVRDAARSRAGHAQEALGAAVTGGLPPRDKIVPWWRLVAMAQWLLLLLVVAGVAWIGVILAYGQFHVAHKAPSSLVSDLSLIPWLVVMVVALLLLGSLTSSWCQNMVILAADRERDQAVQAIRSRVAAVTRELVLAPVGKELADYERFRTELAAAKGLFLITTSARPPRTLITPRCRRIRAVDAFLTPL